jgi:hypothetical protein
MALEVVVLLLVDMVPLLPTLLLHPTMPLHSLPLPSPPHSPIQTPDTVYRPSSPIHRSSKDTGNHRPRRPFHSTLSRRTLVRPHRIRLQSRDPTRTSHRPPVLVLLLRMSTPEICIRLTEDTTGLSTSQVTSLRNLHQNLLPHLVTLRCSP